VGHARTNGQHAYFQLLHQGTKLVPIDLIGFARPSRDAGSHQDLLMANLFAQAEALAFGRTREEVEADGVSAEQAPHRTFPGNRPTTTILATELTPASRQLIAVRAQVFRRPPSGTSTVRPVGVEPAKVLAVRAPELEAEAS
jgi:glucose-6-phosphate isomerase